MPLYFAYGSNMDRAAMRLRCPSARALGRARLARHKLFIMSSGYASVKCDPRTDVHGVLYELAMCDIAILDRYEDVGRGLYGKHTQPVLREGASPMRALIYIGRSQGQGRPAPNYLDAIIAAAKDWALPDAYVAYIAGLSGDAQESGTARRWRAIQMKGV